MKYFEAEIRFDGVGDEETRQKYLDKALRGTLGSDTKYRFLSIDLSHAKWYLTTKFKFFNGLEWRRLMPDMPTLVIGKDGIQMTLIQMAIENIEFNNEHLPEMFRSLCRQYEDLFEDWDEVRNTHYRASDFEIQQMANLMLSGETDVTKRDIPIPDTVETDEVKSIKNSTFTIGDFDEKRNR